MVNEKKLQYFVPTHRMNKFQIPHYQGFIYENSVYPTQFGFISLNHLALTREDGCFFFFFFLYKSSFSFALCDFIRLIPA